MSLGAGTQFHILEAGDGKAGLLLARERCPNLIVADVMMPSSIGSDWPRPQVRPDDRRHPIILLTRGADSATRCRLEAGADAYLMKRSTRRPDSCVTNLLHQRGAAGAVSAGRIAARHGADGDVGPRLRFGRCRAHLWPGIRAEALARPPPSRITSSTARCAMSWGPRHPLHPAIRGSGPATS